MTTKKSSAQPAPLGLTVDQLGHGVGVLQRHLSDQHAADESARIAQNSRVEFLRAMGWKESTMKDDEWTNAAVRGARSAEDALELTRQALQVCGFLPAGK